MVHSLSKVLQYFGHFLMVSLKTNINSWHRMTNSLASFVFVHGQHLIRKCLLGSTRTVISINTESWFLKKEEDDEFTPDDKWQVASSLLVEDARVDRRLLLIRLVFNRLDPVWKALNPSGRWSYWYFFHLVSFFTVTCAFWCAASCYSAEWTACEKIIK